MRIHTAILISALLALIGLIGCTGSGLVEGNSFKSEAEFKKSVEDDDFVVIGSFNLKWPATITSVESAENEIRIDIPDFSRNEYPGLTGYKLKAVVLKRDDGKYSGFVLRAKEKS